MSSIKIKTLNNILSMVVEAGVKGLYYSWSPIDTNGISINQQLGPQARDLDATLYFPRLQFVSQATIAMVFNRLADDREIQKQRFTNIFHTMLEGIASARDGVAIRRAAQMNTMAESVREQLHYHRMTNAEMFEGEDDDLDE